jgi:DNA polymerase-3 subunit epsilon
MTVEQWQQMPLNVLDFETTGVDPTTDRAVQAAFVQIRPGTRPVVRTWLVNPGVEIPKGASDIHGISTDHAREHGGDPAQMLFELTGLVALGLGHDIPLVAFNAAFDLTLLEAENQRHGIEALAARLPRGQIRPVVDPFVLDKQISRRRGKRTLVDQCRHYTVPHTGAHDAAADAIATGRLVPKIMAAAAGTKNNAQIVRYSLITLHQAQIGWRAEQCDSLRDYFDGRGIEHDGVDPGWPIYQKAVRTETAGAA